MIILRKVDNYLKKKKMTIILNLVCVVSYSIVGIQDGGDKIDK